MYKMCLFVLILSIPVINLGMFRSRMTRMLPTRIVMCMPKKEQDRAAQQKEEEDLIKGVDLCMRSRARDMNKHRKEQEIQAKKEAQEGVKHLMRIMKFVCGVGCTVWAVRKYKQYQVKLGMQADLLQALHRESEQSLKNIELRSRISHLEEELKQWREWGANMQVYVGTLQSHQVKK